MSSNISVPKICELCGKTFIAKKTTTQYCSPQCSQRAYKNRLRNTKIEAVIEDYEQISKPFPVQFEKISQKTSHKNKPNLDELPILNSKEFLTVQETAKLFGLCRATVNNYCAQGKLRCVMINRKIFIRRKDIEGLFDYAPVYKVKPKPVAVIADKPPIARKQLTVPNIKEEPKTISEFYTADEIEAKYNYSKSAIYKIVAQKSVPKTVYRGRTLFSKEHIDIIFEPKTADPSINEWYSVDEIKALYEMSTSAVYSLACDYSVPRKNDKGKSYYSKKHIDALLAHRKADDAINEWYTVEDISDKYGLTPGYIANFVYKNGIPKTRKGGKGYYSKEHFDVAIKEKKPANEYIYFEDAMKEYSLSRDSLAHYVKANNIPKIKDGRRVKLLKPAIELVFNPPKIQNYGN